MKKIVKVSTSFLLGAVLSANVLAQSTDFESGLVWENTGQFSWVLNSGGTPSGSTGPTAGDGQYAYFETSSGSAFDRGDQAFLVSEEFTPLGESLSFDYHMYGSNIGTLSVSVLDGSVWDTIWSLTGQQQSSGAASWTRESIDLSDYNGEDIKLRFEATALGNYRGDIAIDNIAVSSTSSTSTIVIGGSANNFAAFPGDFSGLPTSITFTVAGSSCIATRNSPDCEFSLNVAPGEYSISESINGAYADFYYDAGCDTGNDSSSCRVNLLGGSYHAIGWDIDAEDLGAE